MPMLDMPLSQLKTYAGLNPCPPDIDAFWDKQIEKMEALGTDFELEPASFQVPGAQCYHLYFTGMGGARIHAKLARPEKIDKPARGMVGHGVYRKISAAKVILQARGKADRNGVAVVGIGTVTAVGGDL